METRNCNWCGQPIKEFCRGELVKSKVLHFHPQWCWGQFKKKQAEEDSEK